MLKITFFICMLILMGGCSTTSVDLSKTNTTIVPAEVTQNFKRFEGASVGWGGMILNSKNLTQVTRLEVLAYPLNSNGKPQSESPPLTRFLVDYGGYLETAEYRQGRWITAKGIIMGIKEGKVGEANYTYPLLQAQDLFLWPEDTSSGSSRVHFGIGIGVYR